MFINKNQKAAITLIVCMLACACQFEKHKSSKQTKQKFKVLNSSLPVQVMQFETIDIEPGDDFHLNLDLD
jgi:hypothetical protein